MTIHDHALDESPHRPALVGFRRGRPLPPIHSSVAIVACSRCLRIQRGAHWLEADEVIRELRSFELPEAPTLRPGLCDRCTTAIQAKRGRVDSRAAA